MKVVVAYYPKSGATISRDYFKRLRYFAAKLMPSAVTCALVYDGAEKQQRSDVTIWRTKDIKEMMRNLA